MTTEAYPPPQPDEELELILAEYLRAVESGARPDREQLLARHPHLAEELSAFLANHAHAERWTLALRPAATPPPSPGKVQRFGAYDLLGEIARGGMGIVYRAREMRTGRLVALKRMRTDRATPDDVERFRTEAEAAANLDHPNVVPIYEVGEHDGQPYFSMKLIEGGSLAQRLAAGGHRPSAQDAGHLVATVARAVHHAHQRRILHRDLKPGNILLGDSLGPTAAGRQPTAVYVTDFGLAKHVEDDTGLTLPGVIVGTPSYMAPEQAAGVRLLTTAVDIYSLGAILYELLTGRPPFRGPTSHDVLRQLQEAEPTPPRALNPLVDRDLETICLKCLEKDPAQRYGSAEALADDLERVLAGGHPLVRRPGLTERFTRWCRRHPATAAAAALLVVITLTAIGIARDREARLRREVLRLNQDMAGHVASTVLLQLEQLARPVTETAELSTLRECLEGGDDGALQHFVVATHRKYADPRIGFARPGEEPPFKSWYVLDLTGRIRAVSPENPDILNDPFAGRDYFQGALRHAGQSGKSAVHISRLFRAVNDGLYKFAISAPIHNAQRKPIGVLAATVPTASTVGTLRLTTERRLAVLAGREDTTPRKGAGQSEAPEKYRILLHPAYQTPGMVAVAIDNAALRQTQQRPRQSREELDLAEPGAAPAADDRYFDPAAELDAAYAGRWLAGFAPVGNTEMVVIVQQRYDDALGYHWTWSRELLLPAGLALVLLVLLLAALVRRWRRQARAS